MLLDRLDGMIADGMQLALLGSGDPHLEHAFVAAAGSRLGGVGCVLGYNEALAHLIQAGSDALLAPSRFEPCGLTQLCALRYGSIPVVSGLAALPNSVIDANEAALAAGVATGIQFWPATSQALQVALRRLSALWRDRPAWERMQRNGMAADVSWRGPARRYIALYQSLLADRRETNRAWRGSGRAGVAGHHGRYHRRRRHRRRGACARRGRRRDLSVRCERRGNQPHTPSRSDRARASRPCGGVPAGSRYGLRAFGPWDPGNGHRFNPSKLLVDPWATTVDRPFRLHPLLFDRERPTPGRHRRTDAEGDRRSTAPPHPSRIALLSIGTARSFSNSTSAGSR